MKIPLTYGLTHVAVSVKDLERTKQFYTTVFDMTVMYQEPTFIQLTTPGSNDILVFEKKENASVGVSSGISHFGFRLRRAEDIGEIRKKIVEAGGRIKEEGEFVPGSPFIFFFDPDGYEIEVWYELLDQ